MDCRNCQPTLIDLLYGELATDAAEAARAHLRECANCRGAYDKLTAGLRVARTIELVEPPPRVEQKLLELAQARALAIAEQRAAAAPPALSPLRLVIDFVRRLAMARQANMVAVSLLVAAVVMLALPQLLVRPQEMKPAEQSASRIPVAPDVQEETTPSDGVKPAERLGLKMDSHSGRIRSTDDDPAAALQPAAEPPPLAAPEAREEKKSASPRAAAAHAYRARGDLEYAKSETLAKDKQQQAVSIDDLLDGARGPAAAAPARPSPRPFPSNEGELAREAAPRKAALDEGLRDKLASSSASGGRANGAGAGTVAPASPAAKPSSMPVAALRPTTNAQTTLAAQLQAARTIARRDGCAVALSRYQQIVASGGGTLEAGEALLDMADCRMTLGQPTLARALLERAAKIPAVAPRARALLSAESDAPAPMGGPPPAAAPGR